MYTQTFVFMTSDCTELSFIRLMKKLVFFWLQLLESWTLSKSVSVNTWQSGMRTKALTANSASRFSKCCVAVAFNVKETKLLNILHEWTKTTEHFSSIFNLLDPICNNRLREKFYLSNLAAIHRLGAESVVVREHFLKTIWFISYKLTLAQRNKASSYKFCFKKRFL